MICGKAIAITTCLFAVAAAAQIPVAPTTAPAPTVTEMLTQLPGYNQLYCGMFISEQPIQDGLFIIAAEEGGMKNEFIPGDVVYLSRGSGWIVNPSGEYMVIRKVKDFVRHEPFRGQQKLLESLGTTYVEVGRIRVNIVHERSATAMVLHACESLMASDIAIPFNVKPAPPLKPSAGFDRFAPANGKTTGMLVTGKEFVSAIRAGEIAVLDIGARQGVAVGQYYRIFRPYSTYRREQAWRPMQEYLEKAVGVRMGIRLTPDEIRALPREVIGELVITHVEGRSASALVTYTAREAYVGDFVELE